MSSALSFSLQYIFLNFYLFIFLGGGELMLQFSFAKESFTSLGKEIWYFHSFVSLNHFQSCQFNL